MFKKAGDNVHFLDRTGSHSTKGSRRGIDRMAPMTADDFDSEQNIIARRAEIRALRRLIAADIAQVTQMKAVMLQAAEADNAAVMDALRPILNEANDRIRANKVILDELRLVTPKRHHPGRRPDYDEIRRRKVTGGLLRYPPAWWEGAGERRRTKYLKWLQKLGTVDETRFR